MKKTCFLLLCLFVSLSAFCQTEPQLTRIGVFDCGKQPKQVVFSPDGKYVILPLLDDTGFDVFSIEQQKLLRRINPPQAEKKGFAEGIFIPEKKAFLVSQMTTAKVYEYSYPDFTLRRTIDTKGTWSKFIAWSSEKQMLAVSNWVSNDISLIAWESGTLIRSIKTGAAPRGMVFINKGNELLSLSFDDGIIEKFSVTDGKRLAKLSIANAAMRHIVLDSTQTYAFVSDMYHRTVYKIDVSSLTIKESCRVFNNPNTIALLDDKWLFVSCRGPNNPDDYTKRSPVNGKIYVIKTEGMEMTQSLDGGNQPTGLDINADGTMLCFSNFQDANIELYRISR